VDVLVCFYLSCFVLFYIYARLLNACTAHTLNQLTLWATESAGAENAGV